jgi:hypothetical protein
VFRDPRFEPALRLQNLSVPVKSWNRRRARSSATA